MTESVEEPGGRREGKVRLRRSGLMAVPAAAIAGGLVVLTAQGLIAAQFAISGIPFVVTADSLHGEGFEQWGYLDQTADGSPNLSDSNGQQVVMVSAIKDATLHNLCQSINLGGVYLVLTAGSGDTPVTAHNLVVDSDQLSGDQATFKNINVGQDASTVDAVPGVTGPLGDFAQQADQVDIAKVRQNNWATTAAQFALPGLSMSFKSSGC
jgi:hypothetical protein